MKSEDIIAYSKSATALKSKGNKALADGDYLLAQLYYEALVQKMPTSEKYQFQLAKIYLQNKLYIESENLFEKVISFDKTASLYLSAAQIAQGKYADAKKNFDIYKKTSKEKREPSEDLIYKSVSSVLKNKAATKSDSLSAPTIIRLNRKVNGKLSEFTPFYLTDTTFFFGKTTPDESQFYLKTDSQTTAIPVRKYFTGTISKDGEVTTTNPWIIYEKDSSINFGGACFNADKTMLYFTQCERKLNALECHIYQSKKTKDGWSKPAQLQGKINTEGYTSAQPSLGYDAEKKVDVLYFSSNMPGAKGFDIYYSVFDKGKREFSYASKCGPKINSSGDEYTPFYSQKDSTLYFSSNGKGGFGGQDIFSAKGNLSSWAEPAPLPTPINSPADDDYFSIDTKNNRGFFASNRNSESSTTIKTCCDDIYAFYLSPLEKKPLEPVIKKLSVPLKVAFENGVTATDSARISVFEVQNGKKTQLFLNPLVGSDTTLLLILDKQYKITLSSKSHLAETKEIKLENITQSKLDTQYIYPKAIPRKAIVIPGINYEFDSSRLIPESIQKIEEFIYPLLLENPQLIFQINSHTDSKGNDDYNQKLSEQRAKSVVDYLTQIKGISFDRLRYKGYGESKPIAPNELPNGKDNPEGRAQNRRTEFEVVGGIDQFLK